MIFYYEETGEEVDGVRVVTLMKMKDLLGEESNLEEPILKVIGVMDEIIDIKEATKLRYAKENETYSVKDPRVLIAGEKIKPYPALL